MEEPKLNTVKLYVKREQLGLYPIIKATPLQAFLLSKIEFKFY